MSVQLAYHVAKDLFAAVTFLHQVGILHRDIKPRNLLQKYTKVKPKWALTDFNCAVDTNIEEVGHSIGTADFLPTDVASNEVKHSKSTDVYSCGVTLFKGLTRQLPRQGVADELNDADEDIWKTIKLCLAKQSGDRPTAEQALQMLW